MMNSMTQRMFSSEAGFFFAVDSIFERICSAIGMKMVGVYSQPYSRREQNESTKC